MVTLTTERIKDLHLNRELLEVVWGGHDVTVELEVIHDPEAKRGDQRQDRNEVGVESKMNVLKFDVLQNKTNMEFKHF
jgi:hypothetical protein